MNGGCFRHNWGGFLRNLADGMNDNRGELDVVPSVNLKEVVSKKNLYTLLRCAEGRVACNPLRRGYIRPDGLLEKVSYHWAVAED